MEPLTSAGIDAAAAVCLGSGRFLRAVLVPALEHAQLPTIIFQTRGNAFPDMMYGPRRAQGSYELDTVEFDGRVTTTEHKVIAAATLGSSAGRAAWLSLPSKLPRLRVIGLGVTEAGIAPKSQAIRDLAEFLLSCQRAGVSGPLSVINTDNIPGNGAKISSLVKDDELLAAITASPQEKQALLRYLEETVVFHATMVDRITSQRQGTELDIPRAEPLPSKALVIEDLKGVLPPGLEGSPGVWVRRSPGQIEVDHQLKLRIANAIHTAMVYLMVLSRQPDTSACIGHPLILPYIEALYRHDILPMAEELGIDQSDVQLVYDDWVRRLQHPQFGLSCLFVCQNASQKLGIRLAPSIANVLKRRGELPSRAMAFAVAAMLRFLTPLGPQPSAAGGVFKGRMDPVDRLVPPAPSDSSEPPACPPAEVTYAGQLKASYVSGTYDFKDGTGVVPRLLQVAAAAADSHPPSSPARFSAVLQAVETILSLPSAGNLEGGGGAFSTVVASLYLELLSGRRAMPLLKTVMEAMELGPLNPEEIPAVVADEISKVEVIDLHTHLFPPSHGSLMLWGIDELLTYHYLVAEYFQAAPIQTVSPDHFFSLSKRQQADLIWDALFIQRSPLSEGAKGVLTTLSLLGLRDELRRRDLTAIRAWFDAQDPATYSETVFRLSRVKYCVMTNIPFDKEEASHWRPQRKHYSSRFKSALRVDPLLKGDWETVEACLKAAGYELSLEGAKQYVRDWVTTMEPEYLMASTPHDFSYQRQPTPHKHDDCSHEADGCGATLIDRSPKGSELLEKVLIPIAQELQLPIALKLGAHRQVNPLLRSGGDGLVVADVGDLRRLCTNYPKVKFLATFLSRVNQHEAAVLANKFPNLHLYGCWWYCNNPSIIREITSMRVEILGTGFTAQHSDARVLDQLLYKWSHSRKVIGEVLTGEYLKVAESGWAVSRKEIRRDIRRLLGGAYEEFMCKRL